MSNEKINNRLKLSVELKRTHEKTNLILKFRQSFTYPICLGILINIIVTIYFLMNFSTNLNKTVELTEIIHKAENDRNIPIIENVGNIIYKKFQPSIYILNSFKKYIRQITNQDFLDIKDESFASKTVEEKRDLKKEMIDFAKKYSLNINEMYNNYNDSFNKIKDDILDYSYWFLNKNLTTVESFNETESSNFPLLRKIYLLSNLNLLFKSHYELYKDTNFTGITRIYGGFSKAGIYFSYPLYNETYVNNTGLGAFIDYKNPPDCRDEFLKIPSYFYFKCRPWYKETVSLYKNDNFNITITYPYLFMSKDTIIGISTCITINNTDIFGHSNKYNEDLQNEEFLIICVDLPLSDIISVFDYLNNMINGYFFVLRINSDKPIYYPQLKSKNNLDNLVRYEFDNYMEYFIDDLIDFKKNGNIKMLREFKLSEALEFDQYPNNTFNIAKNGTEYNYTIFPISLNLGDKRLNLNNSSDNSTDKYDPDQESITNMINVVYVTEKSLFDYSINNINQSLTAKIVFSVLIIIILGCIVLLITFYLINSIATNILRPIKMMNSILVGINKEKKETEDQEISNLKKSRIKSSMSKSNLKTYQKLNDEDNEFENEDDDLLDIRSEDIDNLFQTLIDLKKTLNYVQVNSNINENEYKFLNLLFAKNTLNNVHNIQARLLCNSNLGNLAIKFKKYDKAIVHLWESVKLNKKYINKKNEYFNEFMDNLPQSYGDPNPFSIKDHIGYYESEAENEESKLNKLRSIELEVENKINIESRIPKLIFAFKKFFKNLNKMLKMILKDHKFVKILDNVDEFYSSNLKHLKSNEIYQIFREKIISYFIKTDIFTNKKFHNFLNFKTVIDQYLGQAIDTKNDRLKVLAEFELIDFVIKYILIPLEFNLKCSDRIYSYMRLNNSNIHETKITLLNRNIGSMDNRITSLREELKNQIDRTRKVILSDKKDSTEKYLISKKLSKKNFLEYSDLPKSVLLQRIYFLEAKFYFNYDLKESFLKLSTITKFQDDVIDGVILISSYKKMQKIFRELINKLEYLNSNESNSRENLIKFISVNLNINNLLNKTPSININNSSMPNLNNNNNIMNSSSNKALEELSKINSNAIINLNNANSDTIKILKDASDEFVKIIRQKAEMCITGYSDEIARYSITSKDIAVLLDYSDNFNEKEKKEKAQKFFEYIFENICTFNDRISIFGYNETTFQLLSLMPKNNKTIKLIENHFKEIWKNNEFYSKKETPIELVKAIGNVYNCIGRKDIYNKREKWIIVLTDVIAENDLKIFEEKKKFLENVYGSKKNENLIIVKLKSSDNRRENSIMEDALKFNKSCYIDLEKKHLLKSRMRIEGVINESSIFDNEIYNP